MKNIFLISVIVFVILPDLGFAQAYVPPDGKTLLFVGQDGDKHIFRFIKEQRIEAFCYINSNWDIMPIYKGQHWSDARVEKFPELKQMWLEEINDDFYLKASPGLFDTLGWEG